MHLIQRRFDEKTAVKARPLIMSLDSPEMLETVSNWVIDCTTGVELLEKLGYLGAEKM